MDTQKLDNAGTSRRGLLKCMAWAGTGIVWTVAGGIPRGLGLSEAFAASAADGFTFVQISDSHIGFDKEANPDPNATFQEAIDRIAKLPKQPAMVLHTGDVSHLSKPVEFDTAAGILKAVKQDIHYVPGEHDVIGDDGKEFFERFAPKVKTGGWYSFDQGAHCQHANRHFHARADVAALSTMGMGDRGRTASAGLSEAVRLGDRTQRPYPPGRAEGRRQRHLSDRAVDRLPAAGSGARPRPGPAQGPRRQTQKRDRHP